jgi:hypothetical protein
MKELIQHPDFGQLLFHKKFDNGYEVTVVPQLWGYAVLGLTLPETKPYKLYANEWLYHDAVKAVAAAEAWNGEGEPKGWNRHRPSGRRRSDGTPESEFVRYDDWHEST